MWRRHASGGISLKWQLWLESYFVSPHVLYSNAVSYRRGRKWQQWRLSMKMRRRGCGLQIESCTRIDFLTIFVFLQAARDLIENQRSNHQKVLKIFQLISGIHQMYGMTQYDSKIRHTLHFIFCTNNCYIVFYIIFR